LEAGPGLARGLEPGLAPGEEIDGPCPRLAVQSGIARRARKGLVRFEDEGPPESARARDDGRDREGRFALEELQDPFGRVVRRRRLEEDVHRPVAAEAEAEDLPVVRAR